MKFRKLRIAWSVCWGLAAALLIVLWMRSHWWCDEVVYKGNVTHSGLQSSGGTVAFHGHVSQERRSNARWQLFSEKTNEIGYFHVSRYGFVWEYVPADLFVLGVPHLFLVAMATIASAIGAHPWLRWRFSLRTLLIATTLVAVVLGLAVFLSRN